MKFNLDRTLDAILRDIESAGGKVFFVGGYVRDYLMSEHWESHDIDLEIFCFDIERLKQVLIKYGNVSEVGKSFGILKLDILNDVDFALAREEVKTGHGHQDFEIELFDELDIQRAAKRRDFTINAMYLEYATHKIHDPYHGRDDLKEKLLRMVSDETFKEDPLRVLRLAQFISRFNFKAEEKTQAECERIVAKGELKFLSDERIFNEYNKMLMGDYPSNGIKFLRDINGLLHQVQVLDSTPQRLDYHPEGNVLNHTMMVVDLASLVKQKAANPSYFMWANFLHDIGKAVVTTADLHAPNHSGVGSVIFEEELAHLIKSKEMNKYLKVMIQEHMSLMNMARKSNQEYNYLKLLHKIEGVVSLDELVLLTKCDKLGRSREGYHDYKLLTGFVGEMVELHGKSALKPFIRGRDLLDWGIKNHKEYSNILNTAYDMQLRGMQEPEIVKIIRGRYGE